MHHFVTVNKKNLLKIQAFASLSERVKRSFIDSPFIYLFFFKTKMYVCAIVINIFIDSFNRFIFQ